MLRPHRAVCTSRMTLAWRRSAANLGSVTISANHKSSAFIDEVRAHLPLIGTTLSAFLVAFRIFSVAGYDPETAFGLLQAAGTGTVIFGTILSLLGWVPAYALLFALINYDKIARQFSLTTCLTLIVASFVLAIWISPVAFLIMMTAMIALETYTRFPTKEKKRLAAWPDRENPAQVARYNDFANRMRLQGSKKKGTISWALFVAFLVAFITLNTTPWLPAEELRIRGDAPPVTAYVLSTAPNFTAVLTGAPPRIEYIPTSSITNRAVH